MIHQKSTILFQTILFHLLLVPFWTNAVALQQNPLTKAIQLFDKEKFAEAEPIFRKLLDERPDDFMVNYFYGACRTENGHYADHDLFCLEKASKEVTPLNIDYYFGVQYHAKNHWEKALAFYKLYKSTASVNDQEKVKLSLKMEQCINRVNPFISSETNENGENTETPVIVATSVIAVSDENIAKTEDIPEIPNPVETTNTEIEVQFSEQNDSTLQINEPELNIADQETEENPQPEITKAGQIDEQIKFNINSEITYIFVSNFKTEEGKIYFKEGNIKQTELNEVIKETENLREKYTLSKSRSEKDSIGQKILASEGQAYELKSVITQMFLQAKTVENGYWQNANPEETENFIRELSTESQEINNKNAIKDETILETPELIIPPILMDSNEVKSPAPKVKSSGIVYKIQLGAYSRGIPNNLKSIFNKISILRKVENYTDENGVVVYTTGNLANYDDAVVMQNQIRQEGIKDAQIAAYLNGKRITLEQAKEIENEK